MSDQTVHPAIPPSEQSVEFELNGKKVFARKGETIITVAAREGVSVPHYCWHPALSVAGNCRLCLVEMHMADPKDPAKKNKLPKPVIACQTPVAPGSAVFTESALSKDCQNGMMEFLLLNHPLDCPICDRGGECQLQRYSMEYGRGHSRFVDKKRKFLKPNADPMIDIERNRCIMCTRCVRFCDEVAGEHVMGVFDRGEGNYIGTFGQGPVSNIYSGNVIDICPVGCLTSKPFRFSARPWELHQTQSTGIFDASGPKVTHWTRNGKLYRTTPPSRKYHGTYTVNEDTEEFIDNLTRFGSDFSKHADRCDEHRVRIGDALFPSAHVEAVKQTASAMARLKVAHGGNAIAVLVSPRATMEEGYLAGKFARIALGSDSVDWRSGVRSAEAAAAIDLAIRHADGDMASSPDMLFLINGDFQHTVPTFAMRLKEQARILGRPIVLFGHHHDSYFAEHATMVFTTKPGETGHALGLLTQLLESQTPDTDTLIALAKATGTKTDDVKALLELLTTKERGLVLHSLEDCNGMFLRVEVPNAISLRQDLGRRWGYVPVLRDRNAFGLHAVGAQPGLLPGDPGSVVATWKTDRFPTTGGVGATDLLAAIESGKVKALVCFGADALHNFADDERVLAALDKLEFFALSDLFHSAYAEKADVFFAAASNLERDGTYADVQGNLARLVAAEPPKGSAVPDWVTITQIAQAMGVEGFRQGTIADVFKEMMRAVVPTFRGSFKGLELAGPANDVTIADPGGARRNSPEYNPGDFRTDGAHLRSAGPEVDPIDVPPGAALAGDGFVLTWGTHVQGDDYHLNHATIANLLKVAPYIELNEADASALGVDDNQLVAITMPEGDTWEAAARVRKSGPGAGSVWVPAGVGPVNLRKRTALCRVSLEPLAKRGVEQELVAGGIAN